MFQPKVASIIFIRDTENYCSGLPRSLNCGKSLPRLFKPCFTWISKGGALKEPLNWWVYCF